MVPLKYICTLLALTLFCGSASAVTQADLDVQILGSFPKLARLSSQGGREAGAYLQRVSKAYTAAGYHHLGPELRRSRALIMILSKTGKTNTPPVFKLAKASLLRLSRALAKDAFVKIPKVAGQSIPDYYHLAAQFILNARTALKNVRHGSNPGENWSNQGNLWIGTTSNGIVTITGGLGNFGAGALSGGTLVSNPDNLWSVLTADASANDLATFGNVGSSSSSFSMVSVGTLTLSAANTYTGSTTIREGTLTIYSMAALGDGQVTLNGGSLAIAEPGIWAIFPPDVEIPDDFSSENPVFELGTISYKIGGTEFPVGTEIVKVPDGALIPDGAIELIAPATFTPVATPTPAPEE